MLQRWQRFTLKHKPGNRKHNVTYFLRLLGSIFSHIYPFLCNVPDLIDNKEVTLKFGISLVYVMYKVHNGQNSTCLAMYLKQTI